LQNEFGDYTTTLSTLQNFESLLGASFEELTNNDKQRLNIPYGVRVANIKRNGLLGKAGISNNYIILRIDRQPVNSPDELFRRLAGNNDVVLVEGIYPNGVRAHYALDLATDG
jgi:S1-C subfamily serine protease